MIGKGRLRRSTTFASAVAAAVLSAAAVPSAAMADALRPLNVTLTCTDYGRVGLPYGYQIDTGAGLYYPPAQSDATVVGNAKTFHLYMPTSASTLGVNTWCNGFDQAATWRGYDYNVTPGTSTVNAVGDCATYSVSMWPGVTYVYTYCTLNSITYS